MTEAEWLTGDDPKRMLTHLERSGTASDRKHWLFAVECCRRTWGLIKEPCCRRAVEKAEQFADGEATRHQLVKAGEEIWAAWRRRAGEPALDRADADRAAWWLTVHVSHPPTAAWNASLDSALAVARVAFPDDGHGIWTHDAHPERWKAAYRQEEAGQAAALRDIVRSPAQPAKPRRMPLGPDVVTLAGHIYHDRAFGLTGDLSDALEEAGCTDADILSHLRSPGPHVRGCWALDLILGNS